MCGWINAVECHTLSLLHIFSSQLFYTDSRPAHAAHVNQENANTAAYIGAPAVVAAIKEVTIARSSVCLLKHIPECYGAIFGPRSE